MVEKRMSWSLHHMAVTIKVLFPVEQFHNIRKSLSQQEVNSLSVGHKVKRLERLVSTIFLNYPNMLLLSMPFHTFKQLMISTPSSIFPRPLISNIPSHNLLPLISQLSTTMSVMWSTTSHIITILGIIYDTLIHRNSLSKAEMNLWVLLVGGSQGIRCQLPSSYSKKNNQALPNTILSHSTLIPHKNHQE